MGNHSHVAIVAIDDDPHHLHFVVTLLERAGYVVAGFTDAQDALEAIERLSPRLVVTDIFMPRIDGFEVLRRVRSRTPPLPVVALSGKVSGHGALYLDSIRMLGATAAFAKPIRDRDLVGAIDGVLGGPTSAAR